MIENSGRFTPNSQNPTVKCVNPFQFRPAIQQVIAEFPSNLRLMAPIPAQIFSPTAPSRTTRTQTTIVMFQISFLKILRLLEYCQDRKRFEQAVLVRRNTQNLEARMSKRGQLGGTSGAGGGRETERKKERGGEKKGDGERERER